jgi:hypothetical protein
MHSHTHTHIHTYTHTRVEADRDEVEEEGAQRGARHREYIKDKLVSHVIWQDGNYWEQALWKCTIEQVRSICMYVCMYVCMQ